MFLLFGLESDLWVLIVCYLEVRGVVEIILIEVNYWIFVLWLKYLSIIKFIWVLK